MNDRYLFRAKRKNWKELPKEEWWVQGYYQKRTDVFGKEEHLIFIGESCRSWERAEIDLSTLCQCTGLKDKSGTLIWENDVVRVLKGTRTTICEVKYADNVAQFQLWQKYTLPNTPTVLNLGNYFTEVIGNIFDEGVDIFGKRTEKD